MSDLNEVSRIICDHQWDTPQDWVLKLDELADLNDEQIGSLIRLSTQRARRAGP
jgi:hypothetical protein